MKIYLENYDIRDLSKRLKNLDKYYKKTEKYTEIFSEEGIYYINDSSIYKITNIKDDEIEKANNLYNKYSILIDRSKFMKENVYQVPYKETNIETNIVVFIYSIHNSKLQLRVEGRYENNNFMNNNENKYYEFLPINFYFTDFIIDEINVFLSVLN